MGSSAAAVARVSSAVAGSDRQRRKDKAGAGYRRVDCPPGALPSFPLSRGALHLILKVVFGMGGAPAELGPEWEPQAAVLASASAHWLRHTAGSHMTDRQVDLRFVRDNFGHASISTTSDYLHSEEDARHEATQERHRMGGQKKSEACG